MSVERAESDPFQAKVPNYVPFNIVFLLMADLKYIIYAVFQGIKMETLIWRRANSNIFPE